MNEDISDQIAQVEAMDLAGDLESGTRRLEAEGAEAARLNGKLGEALGEAQRLREHLADAVEAYDREVEAHASTTRLLTAARLDAHEQRETAERMTGNFDDVMMLGRWLLAESEWKRQQAQAALAEVREQLAQNELGLHQMGAQLAMRTPEWYASVRDSLSAIAEATGYGSTDLSGLPEHVARLVPHPSISESHIVPEVHITFRECDGGTWQQVARGISVQTDDEGRLACIEIETWKHAQRGEDERLLAAAQARVAADSGERIDLEDAAAELGVDLDGGDPDDR